MTFYMGITNSDQRFMLPKRGRRYTWQTLPPI